VPFLEAVEIAGGDEVEAVGVGPHELGVSSQPIVYRDTSKIVEPALTCRFEYTRISITSTARRNLRGLNQRQQSKKDPMTSGVAGDTPSDHGLP
jgi:hypothetical protein